MPLELWKTAAEKAAPLNLAQLAYLEDDLREAGAGTIADLLKPTLEVLLHLNAENVGNLRRPFFWNAMRRLRRLLFTKTDSEPAGQRASHFRTLAFDAFYELLPDGFSIPVNRERDGGVLLPSLGLRFDPSVASLEKQDRRWIRAETSRGPRRVEQSSIPPSFKLRTARIRQGGPQLLLDAGPILFEREFLSMIDGQGGGGPTLANGISQALDFIEQVDSRSGSELLSHIPWYVPVSSDRSDAHRSFSIRGLFGVVFLSAAPATGAIPEWLTLAQAIVHEAAHNELNLYQESHKLFDGADRQFYYSPWRPDPRPLYGLFHGIYVFGKVTKLLVQAMRSPGFSHCRGTLQLLAEKTAKQVRLALAQIPLEKLTPEGRALLKSVQGVINEGDEKSPGAFEGQEAHVTQWKIANPGLAHLVRLPGSGLNCG